LGLIGEESAGNYFSYHFDYRGSTIAITNITGQLVDIVQYSPFGIVLSQPIFDTPFLFNGLYGVMTDGNSLNYMRARYYSADIRRFVNQDVLLGGIENGQSLNRYAYVMGDPIKYNDPFGLDRGCGPGYRSIPDPSQPHVSFCEEDGSDPFEKICVTPECLARDAARCGNDDGARPYIGIGGYVDTHYILFGVNSELAIISEGERTCVFKTECFSLGPGFFMGSGGTFPFGVAIGDIEESLAGSSAGFSFDIGYCLQSYGTNVSTGYNENGITSVGSSKGAGRLGGGCGVSFTLDLCSTKVLSCNKP
jgi:RHS repeat-associated protein